MSKHCVIRIMRELYLVTYHMKDSLSHEASSYAVGLAAVRWTSTFQYVRMSFYPENVGNLSSSPQNDLEFSPRSIQSCFPLLQGPSFRKSPSARFRSKWVTIPENVFFDPIGDCNGIWPSGSKKCWRWFPATGPLEKRETALDRSWRKLQVILRRGRPISKIFGANAHRTYWNVLFQRTANPTA